MIFISEILIQIKVVPFTFFRYYSYSNLLLVNALLRKQIISLKKQRLRSNISWFERILRVTLRCIWNKSKNLLVIVNPETIIKWHRKLFRLYWKHISKQGKRKRGLTTSKKLIELIMQIARENPTWGAPRIHGELLKLGYSVSERTVSRYLSKTNSPLKRKKRTSWKTFINNQGKGIAAMDFFVVPTLFFKTLYCFFIIDHDRRKILHFNVTYHPTAQWVSRQIRDAFKKKHSIQFMICDRDSIFSSLVKETLNVLGIEVIKTAYRSPWQNGIAERWVGSCRRDLLDHVIILNDTHLHRLLGEYVEYYNKDRTHYHLDKDPPLERPVTTKKAEDEKVIALPRLSGLIHKYIWKKSA